MVLNPSGFVPVYDFGAPRIVSGRARQIISGGMFVFCSGPSNAVSSGANSFDPKVDTLYAVLASGAQFNGVAMATVGSNEIVSVMIDGVIIATAFTTVTAGTTVTCEGTDSVGTGTTAGQVIGRALSQAASGGYCLFHIQG